MGIQPIDLQTMYSQLSNVSKSMAAGQQAQLTEAMQQEANIQRGLENASRVNETQTEKSDAAMVNKDGRNGNDAFAGRQNKKRGGEADDAGAVQNREGDAPGKKSSSPYLGTIIDITR